MLVGLLIKTEYLNAQSIGDFRTVGSGIWSDEGIWEYYDGNDWVGASGPPNSSANIITIRAVHNVSNGSGGDIYADQLIIEASASLYVSEGEIDMYFVEGKLKI